MFLFWLHDHRSVRVASQLLVFVLNFSAVQHVKLSLAFLSASVPFKVQVTR